jgi:CheY-like chemotaxis protein
LFEVLSPYYEIAIAADGNEALDMIRSNKFDLIIMDIKMPRMHGLQAVEKIRQTDSEIPIIICSAYPKIYEDFAMPESEINTFINKPIDIKELKATVFEIIGV